MSHHNLFSSQMAPQKRLVHQLDVPFTQSKLAWSVQLWIATEPFVIHMLMRGRPTVSAADQSTILQELLE